jgi:hypothetical protein
MTEKLYEEIYDNFLLNDLQEIAMPTLPKALTLNTGSWTLKGKFSLQVQNINRGKKRVKYPFEFHQPKFR